MAQKEQGGRVAKSAARREAILDATMAEIAERGYRATTIAAVAERVGLTQPGVLHYFPSKEQLLVGVLEARDRWDTSAILANAAPVGLSHLEQIIELNIARRQMVLTYTALAAEGATGQHPASEYFSERYETLRAAFTELLRQEFGDQLAGGLTPTRAAPLLIAMLDGIQSQWLLAPDEIDMRQAYRDFIALLNPNNNS